jgi:hypothetical protein
VEIREVGDIRRRRERGGNERRWIIVEGKGGEGYYK